MNSVTKNILKYYPYLWVILFFIAYLIFYPENWMITDSYNYVNRAIAFSQGQTTWMISDFVSGASIDLIPAPYNTGTSFFYAVFMSLLGKESIFLVPLFQVVFSVFLLSQTITRNRYKQSALAILGLSAAILFFSRSMMSCMPSFLLISIACFIFFREKISKKNAVMLGVVCGLGFWFRESNVFLTAPFVIYLLYKERSFLPYLSLGIFLGLSPKVIADKIVYESWWFSSASSGFSVQAIWDHLPEYAIILSVFIPLSVFFIGLYKGKGDKTIKVASAAFILLYLVYNYSAVDFSGLLKGSFLTSRFMIPLLPIVVICCSEVLTRHKILNKIFSGLALLSLLIIPLSQFVFNKMYAAHEDAAKTLSQKIEGKEVFADVSGYTNIIRYYNPLRAEIKMLSSIQNLKKIEELKPNQVIILSRSVASEEKTMRMDSMKNIITDIPLRLTKSIPIDAVNWLEVYEAK